MGDLVKRGGGGEGVSTVTSSFSLYHFQLAIGSCVDAILQNPSSLPLTLLFSFFRHIISFPFSPIDSMSSTTYSVQYSV